MVDALVDWPSAPLTDRLVTRALSLLHPAPNITSSLQSKHTGKLVQWSAYDSIDHEATHAHPDSALASSFTIRKALIRKHFLARCVQNYAVKHPSTALARGVPRTWDVELAFADELDEKWADELWDLGAELENGDKWWILKPGMADRGMGIRLFNSKEMLEEIFQEFEEDDTDDEDESKDDTAIVVSQLRHFVIQDYISDPLLLDPRQVPIDGSAPPQALRGHKFHLRAYCFAHGALKVYLYTRVLALFSSAPYEPPKPADDPDAALDLTPHLTNTSLQTHLGEEGVRLLSELVGCRVLSHADGQEQLALTEEHVEEIMKQMTSVLAETFKAALEMPVHFQPLPNAFELYGIDFLVSHGTGDSPFKVQLLEVNAEPAIELTGPRLTWILEDLFVAMGRICVQPFLDADTVIKEEELAVRRVLDIEVRGSGGW